MNILVLRHSAEKVKNEGKRDIITASQLGNATGYALKNVQASLFIDVPFIKGWETQRGVKVMSKIEFDKALIILEC
ncbi:hypothetical protein CTM97_18545 [Photobacterium phosphoreum]|uniref:Uncharacterized protein n=1 Tax=Photobacterium phosphoreum TaxID=659 RepID=A0A2T3JBS5_PHOPO|nr:hypothetical protein [Photobacterium phosphoreum]PSU19938.1 hypothetical protein CTM96_20525 [Photobacterium phosphoreum]PSU38787.1 hypothetical protein CTM97_18545 [Photobacterium phosphoreum]PSU46290.1 hypothetical protein C9J18_20705 [Photobacterium phosphoreum]